MSNIEKIRQEIERRKKICEDIFERESDTYYQGKAVAYGELLPFIDSLPEEKPSEDLEEAARRYAEDIWLYGASWQEAEKQNELKPVSFSCSHENGKPAEWMANRRRENTLNTK